MGSCTGNMHLPLLSHQHNYVTFVMYQHITPETQLQSPTFPKAMCCKKVLDPASVANHDADYGC
jgi:hypothetical protein